MSSMERQTAKKGWTHTPAIETKPIIFFPSPSSSFTILSLSPSDWRVLIFLLVFQPSSIGGTSSTSTGCIIAWLRPTGWDLFLYLCWSVVVISFRAFLVSHKCSKPTVIWLSSSVLYVTITICILVSARPGDLPLVLFILRWTPRLFSSNSSEPVPFWNSPPDCHICFSTASCSDSALTPLHSAGPRSADVPLFEHLSF